LAERLWSDEVVETRLHGRRAVINFSNPYPRWVRQFPSYNRPQVIAVEAAATAAARPVHVVDVGAAVGDTALLLLEQCRSEIASLTCIEGDDRFVQLLSRNVDGLAVVHRAMLAAEEGEAPELVRTLHAGTAAALGTRNVPTTTLDLLLADAQVDVLKTDVDGYDGLVLAGARRLVKAQRPVVLFEWHPRACAAAGTSERLAFEVLRDSELFVFYTKYGVFSHVMHGVRNDDLDALATVCRESKLPDWHYDVIAAPRSRNLSLPLLAATGG
jgi:FkbM family methyltransferase